MDGGETTGASLDRVRCSFARQGAMALFGAELAHLAPGEVDIAAAFQDALTQQHGFFHGGVVSALLDTACGFAALTRMAPGTAVLSVEFKLNFLRPAAGPRLLARGRVVRVGRQLTVCTGTAWAGDPPREVAIMQATMACVPDRPGMDG